MSEWQPIETAPQDGTIILICGFTSNGSYYVADVKWGGAWLLFHPDHDEYTEPSFGDPAGWMPLPPPPAFGSQDRSRS